MDLNHQFDQIATIANFVEWQAKFASIPGFLTDLEGYALAILAAQGPGIGHIVEIGSLLGRSTAFLAQGSRCFGREKVTAVDHFKGSPEHQAGQPCESKTLVKEGTTYNRFVKHLSDAGLLDHVSPIVADSVEAAKTWNGPIRLLFIDGDHSYQQSKRDFTLWSASVIPGGLICFHDVPSAPGVTAFYNELVPADLAFREVATVGSIKIIQRLPTPRVSY